MKTQITMRRGSGRRLRRQLGHAAVSKETLFYAIAFGLFGIKMSRTVGGKPSDWMSLVGQESARMLLQMSKDEIDDWLTENVMNGQI
jgi:hypothetical protein